jgi:MFS family permease
LADTVAMKTPLTMNRAPAGSIETPASWITAMAALAVMSVAFGAPYVSVVALKQIAAEFGGERSIPALAYSLVWLGTAVGGIAMGRIAGRIGIRWTAMFGSVMIAAGLVISSRGGATQLALANGVLIGFLGLGGINAPIYVYISYWFDRRRGTALALISSGAYVAGAIWPPLFQQAVGQFGWRHTMLIFAAVELALVLPTAAIFFHPPPASVDLPGAAQGPAIGAKVLGLPPGIVLGLLAVASFLCCVPMAMPQGHLIAFCSDLGIAPSHGAAMLSVLLGSAFISRQIWGYIADRIGGMRTVLAGSACQAAAVAALLFTQDEFLLFTVAAAYGFGFSGIVPAYVVAIRELFPAAEASWRVPTVLMLSGMGMAFGAWVAGALYDHYGFYGAAFGAGLLANILNLVIVGFLVARGWNRGGLERLRVPARA